MGSGGATSGDRELALELGELVARAGWLLLTGGRNEGVMDAASEGAKRVAGSLTIGVLPSESDKNVSKFVDVAIFSGMNNARNAINVLSSDVVVICGTMGPGTASEASLAIKSERSVILLAPGDPAERFFTSLKAAKPVQVATTAPDVIDKIRALFPNR
jgi:uncharacterized protein (TIGR00725 family)